MRIIGPATVVSVAYIDPGNFGANIEAGMKYGLALLWVVWASGLLAVAMQYMAGMIGVKTGRGLLDHLPPRLKPLMAPPLVAMMLATDMTEYMGVVLGLYLLAGLPYLPAAALGLFDVALLALLAERRTAYTAAIAAMVAAVGLSFAVQLALIGPDWRAVALASLFPNMTPEMALVASAIIGATIMPHALILHSHMANGLKPREHGMQTLANLAVASAINASMVIASAYALHGRQTAIVEVPRILEPLYGPLSALLFSLALLLAGVASSSVSVEAGLVTIRYLVGRNLKAWQARLVARMANVVPATAALSAGLDPLTLLVYAQVALAAALPPISAAVVYYSRGLVGRWLTALGVVTTAFAVVMLALALA